MVDTFRPMTSNAWTWPESRARAVRAATCGYLRPGVRVQAVSRPPLPVRPGPDGRDGLTAAALVPQPRRVVALPHGPAATQSCEHGHGHEDPDPQRHPRTPADDREEVRRVRPRRRARRTLCLLTLGLLDLRDPHRGANPAAKQVTSGPRWVDDHPCARHDDALIRREHQRGCEVVGEQRRQAGDARVPGLAQAYHAPPEQSASDLGKPGPHVVIPAYQPG